MIADETAKSANSWADEQQTIIQVSKSICCSSKKLFKLAGCHVFVPVAFTCRKQVWGKNKIFGAVNIVSKIIQHNIIYNLLQPRPHK